MNKLKIIFKFYLLKFRSNRKLKWFFRFMWLVALTLSFYFLRHHDELADAVLWWSPKIFYFKYKNYYDTVLTYEGYAVSGAIFIWFFFFWRHIIFRFFRFKLSTVFFFFYCYFFILGAYFFWLNNRDFLDNIF